MIRINLIAERKASTPKASKATPQYSSEIQENLILIIFVALALGVFFVRRHMINSEVAQLEATVNAKQAEYDKVAHWKDKRVEYEIQKELLTEKIRKITELRDRREGPVKLLEDIFNVVPTSVYLTSIEQGYDARLVKPTGREQKVFGPGKNFGSPNLFKLSGYSKTMDAAGTLANRIFKLTSRYTDGELNTVVESKSKNETQGEYAFTIFFKMVRDKSDSADADKEG